jgi:putative transposase
MTHQNNDTNIATIHELINQYGLEAIPEAMTILFNQAMQLDRSQHLQASPYERSIDRLDYANGYKPKTLSTKMGKIKLAIPQTRHSEFYPSSLERGIRSERALNLALAQMYVQGVSTRDVSKIIEDMCGFEVSSSTVRKAAAQLDDSLSKWRDRELGKYPYIYLDARYEKVRVDGVVRSCAVLIAVGINGKNQRDILGVAVSLSEAEVHWRQFLQGLLKRGLHGVQLLISDAHAGLQSAIQATMTGTAWQRCQFHLQQNAQQYITKRSEKEKIAGEIRNILTASDQHEANRLLKLFVEKYRDIMPKLASWAENNIPQGLVIFTLGLCEFNRKRLRTSNVLERLNRTIKKRTNVAKIFPNTESCLRLVSAITMETAEQWSTATAYLTNNED